MGIPRFQSKEEGMANTNDSLWVRTGEHSFGKNLNPVIVWARCHSENYRFIDISQVSKHCMATAYVLVNCELGSEESIIQQLKSLDGVAEVHGTFGAYDILAKIESATVENLRETITWKIRKIDQIRSTLTLMGIEGQA